MELSSALSSLRIPLAFNLFFKYSGKPFRATSASESSFVEFALRVSSFVFPDVAVASQFFFIQKAVHFRGKIYQSKEPHWIEQ